MRERTATTDVLTYLHGDHLGSASLATDANGGVLSEMRYTPYGETRSGDMATDRRYTGQRFEASLGLYDYNARYYDPTLGRFISADTVVPEPGNPQSLNRYAYVRNNPLKYTDPSGHFTTCNENGQCVDNGYSVDNPAFISCEADERRYQLLLYNNALAQWARNGWITDLDAFVQLANAAASMIPENIAGDRVQIFTYDLAAVLTEYVDDRQYYDQAIHLGQSGFDTIFQDPGAGGEQPHHFWFYVYSVFAYNSRFIATAGNLTHETFLTADTLSFKELVGRSYQDFALGQEGVNLGVNLRNGKLGIGEVGSYIQANLSPNGSVTARWQGNFNRKFYDLCLSAAALIWSIPEGGYQVR